MLFLVFMFDNSTLEMPRELTTKEQLFAEHYLCTFNATEAARKAGYSENAARQQGYENLTKPYIQDYINQKTSAILISKEWLRIKLGYNS